MSDVVLSIITPIFNGEQFLERYFQSLFAVEKSHRKLVELVLVDDGSSDLSHDMLCNFASDSYGFNDVKVLKQINMGSSVARNAGIKIANGKWIMFLDVDDELYSNPIPHIIHHSDKSCVLFDVDIYRNKQLIRHINAPHLGGSTIQERLSAENPLHPPMIIFRKNCIDTLFDTKMLYLEDWLFWLTNIRIFEQCQTTENICLAKIHAHGNNKSGQYHEIGNYRTAIAKQMLNAWSNKAKRKVRNNLCIQAGIGKILSKKGWEISYLSKIPCDLKLYCKLLIYMFLLPIFKRFDIYR